MSEDPNLQIVNAPFTPEQVRELKGYQVSGVMHPFTCANRGDGRHPFEAHMGDTGVLRVIEREWWCPWCDYTQDWAHGFMASGWWREAKRQMDELFGR